MFVKGDPPWGVTQGHKVKVRSKGEQNWCHLKQNRPNTICLWSLRLWHKICEHHDTGKFISLCFYCYVVCVFCGLFVFFCSITLDLKWAFKWWWCQSTEDDNHHFNKLNFLLQNIVDNFLSLKPPKYIKYNQQQIFCLITTISISNNINCCLSFTLVLKKTGHTVIM